MADQKCPGCGWDVNADGNCVNDPCWNSVANKNKGHGSRGYRFAAKALVFVVEVLAAAVVLAIVLEVIG